jgi:hypothetical protein
MTRISAFVLLAALVGCSSQSDQQGAQGPGKEAILLEVGGLIRSYSGETGRGPQKATDFAKYENAYPLGYAAVKAGDMVVVWGAKVAGEGEARSAPANVVAYEKQAPSEGGLVLLQNGEVKKMSAAELASAPKGK